MVKKVRRKVDIRGTSFLIFGAFLVGCTLLWNVKMSAKAEAWGWQLSGDKYYYYENGIKPVTGWYQVSGKWYYFDADGIMQTGWLKDGEKWYFLNSKGAMQTDWVKDSGKWYYFNKKGVMQCGWQKVDDKWYYFNEKGAMQCGWQKVDGKWYFFDSKGVMQVGWRKDDGKWYYFNEKGVMQTGWVKVGEDWFYLNTKGAMQTGWVKDNGKWFFLNSKGVMQTGWLKDKGKWYYLNSGGDMAIGWKKIKGERYYLQEDGTPVISAAKTIGGRQYTFDNRGVVLSADPKPLKTEYHYDSNGYVSGYGLYYVENGKYTKSYTAGNKANLLAAGTVRRDYTYSGKKIKKEDLSIRVRNGEAGKGPGGTHYEVYGSITYNYDSNGRLTEEKTEVSGLGKLSNKKVENTYTNSGALQKQVVTTDAGKNTYEYEYDENNSRVKEKTNGNQTGFWEYKYDADGNPLTIYEVKGSTVTKYSYQYRADGTLKKVSTYKGTKSGSYSEPDPDNPDSAANSLEFYYDKKDGYTFSGSAIKVMEYNEEELLVLETEGYRKTAYTYDEDGDVLTVIVTETVKKEEKTISKDVYTYQ